MNDIPLDIQREKAAMLIEAVCDASGITTDDFRTLPKGLNVNIARGVACVLSRELHIIPRIFGEAFGRSRASVVNVSKHYRGSLSTKDRATVELYNKVKQILQ